MVTNLPEDVVDLEMGPVWSDSHAFAHNLPLCLAA